MTMLALVLTLMLVPQEPVVELTRTEELQQKREEKAQHLAPPTRSFLEKGLLEFRERRVMERFRAGFFGFHPLVGGMQTGSGFALGASYDITKDFKASAQGSFSGYQKYEVVYSKTNFLNDRLFAEIRSTYRNNPQEAYFGTGNDTRSEDEANYRLEDRTVAGQIGIRLKKTVKAGTSFGWVATTIGEGTNSRVPSLGQGFQIEPTYLKAGAFVDIDTRDEPGNPRSGGRYLAKWSSFQDQDSGLHDFMQYDAEVQQYIPFFNQRRVIALRARTTLTQTSDGKEVPFYMLPVMGGSEDLRGYDDFRFRDRNMVVVNAEYRFEAFSGLDVALFADAGQVAATTGDLNFRDMKTAAGFGFRFNTAKKVFYRVDVGFSREGTRIFMKFGNVF
jgi:outer membrane protein assembly factor BamA